MRTVQVTGGYAGTVVGDLTDARAGLDGSTFRAALVAEGGTAPAVGSPSWVPLTVDEAAGSAVLELLVTATTAPGHYWLVVDVVSGAQHELVWALDEHDSRLRALVYVL